MVKSAIQAKIETVDRAVRYSPPVDDSDDHDSSSTESNNREVDWALRMNTPI
jgi:hypothetical protein